MNPVDWLTPALFAVTCTLVGVVYADLRHRLIELKREIGDERGKGLRGDVHRHDMHIKMMMACIVVMTDNFDDSVKVQILRMLKLWRDTDGH